MTPNGHVPPPPPLYAPDDPRAPKYWKREVGGVLPKIVEAFLAGRTLASTEVVWMRAYFRQWINSPVWDRNPAQDDAGRAKLAGLRAAVDGIHSDADVRRWRADAEAFGIDPL